jgi:hypothetical protein
MMLNMKHGYKTGEITKEIKTIKKLKILDKVQEFIGKEQKQIEPQLKKLMPLCTSEDELIYLELIK